MTTMKPNIARLRKVIEAVESAPAKLFDMERYILPASCGTVACAVGWYVMENPECGLPGSRFLAGDIARHFQVGARDIYRLFMPRSYSRPSRPSVLRRLRAFVKRAEGRAK